MTNTKHVNERTICCYVLGQIEESMNMFRILLGQLSVLKRTCMHIIQILFRNSTNYVLPNKFSSVEEQIHSKGY